MKKMRGSPSFSEIVFAAGERTRLEFKDIVDEEDECMKRGYYYHASYGISGTEYEIYVYRSTISPDEIVFLACADEDSSEGMSRFRQEICTDGFSCREGALLIDGMWSCYRKLAIDYHERLKQCRKEA